MDWEWTSETKLQLLELYDDTTRHVDIFPTRLSNIVLDLSTQDLLLDLAIRLPGFVIIQLMTSPLDPLSQPFILSRRITTLIQSILERILSMSLYYWRFPDRVQREIQFDTSKVNEDISDDISLI
jgi:hypothetical protein